MLLHVNSLFFFYNTCPQFPLVVTKEDLVPEQELSGFLKGRVQADRGASERERGSGRRGERVELVRGDHDNGNNGKTGDDKRGWRDL